MKEAIADTAVAAAESIDTEKSTETEKNTETEKTAAAEKTAEAEKKAPRRGRIKWFWVFYTLLIVALLVGSYFFLKTLDGILRTYEYNTTENVLDRLADSLHDGGGGELYMSLEHTTEPWQTDERNAAGIAMLTKGRSISFEPGKAPEGMEGEAYTVSANGRPVFGITVVRQGAPNTPWTEASVLRCIYPVRTVTVFANEYVTVLLDGTPYGQGREVGRVDYPGQQTLPQNLVTPAQIVEYEPFFCYAEPRITGRSANGVERPAYWDPARRGYVAEFCPTTELSALMREMTLDVADRYSRYISHDLSWYGFASCLIREAPIYNALYSLEVQWFGRHSAMYYENIDLYDMAVYSPDCVVTGIAYDVCVIRSGQEIRFPTDISIAFLMTDAGWKVCSISINASPAVQE